MPTTPPSSPSQTAIDATSDDNKQRHVNIITEDSSSAAVDEPSLPNRIRPSQPLPSNSSNNRRRTSETSAALLASRGIPTSSNTSPGITRPGARTRSPILEGLLARGEITPAVFDRLWNIERNANVRNFVSCCSGALDTSWVAQRS